MTEPDYTGWGVIRPGDRVAHYYRESFSLCGRVGFYYGRFSGGDKPSPDDCAKCRKMRDKAIMEEVTNDQRPDSPG